VGATAPRSARFRTALAAEWDTLGVTGRVALLGLVVAVVLAWFLGIGIPAFVEADLIAAHVDSLSVVTDELVAADLIAPGGTVTDPQALDAFLRRRLIGGSVVRVKVWDAEGRIVYSNAPELIGRVYAPSTDRIAAFGGVPQGGHADDGGEEYGTEQALGHLWEFHLPIRSGGEVAAVLEVYEVTPELHESLASIRAWVGRGLAVGFAVLLVLLFSLIALNARALMHKSEVAERLVVEMALAQEEERRRVIGALHDDIGQPLYRVLYGIEGCRSQLDGETAVSAELDRIADLVRWVDGTLRSELAMLHQGAVDHTGLDVLLRRLVDDVRSESPIDVALELGEHGALSQGARVALFRAAREAITNARRHAGARRVSITVTQGSRRVLLDVEDDGSGFAGKFGLGLETTRSRLEAIGGGLRVMAGGGGGTLFRAWVPVSSEAGS
jgi:signal transduction histidine kinase